MPWIARRFLWIIKGTLLMIGLHRMWDCARRQAMRRLLRILSIAVAILWLLACLHPAFAILLLVRYEVKFSWDLIQSNASHFS